MECLDGGILILVSDKFKDFSENAGVVAYVDLLASIESASPGGFPASCIIVGQGLGAEKIGQLREKLQQRGLMAVRIVESGAGRVEHSLVHKDKAENALISVLQKVDDHEFEASLMLDERCAEMSDHVTGKHIQGAVLIEAARQMMMAGVEQHLFSSTERGRYSYVLNTISARFYNYAFPVRVDMRLNIHECMVDERGMFKFELLSTFRQMESIVCEVSCTAQGYPRRLLERLETRRAQNFVRSLREVPNLQESSDVQTAVNYGVSE